MFPSLPFGPITLPTGPIVALIAAYLGLDIAARFGRRFALRVDDVWNAGLIGLAAGLVAARLWTVVQFWYIYADEPGLIVSLRPSGFAFWPGAVAALVAAYAYLLWRALDPVKMAAAFGAGLLMGAAILAAGDYLTGMVTGVASDLPWALPYYGEMQHPAGLYRAVGMLLALAAVILTAEPARPAKSIFVAGLGWGLVHLVADGFAANADLIGGLRTSQVVGFIVAAVCAALLAIDKKPQRPEDSKNHEENELQVPL
jgi:phosphatidylglycerol---prolipoprotein diacylglyceryl transferase